MKVNYLVQGEISVVVYVQSVENIFQLFWVKFQVSVTEAPQHVPLGDETLALLVACLEQALTVESFHFVPFSQLSQLLLLIVTFHVTIQGPCMPSSL